MTRSISLVVFAAAMAVPSLARAGAPPAKPAPSPSAVPSDAVAVIAGEPLTARQFEDAASGRLFQLRTQQYQAQRQILDDEISKRLLEREAAARKVTVEELIAQEVAAKVAPVTAAEQKAYYDENKSRIPPMPEADALKRIEAGLLQQRRAQRQADFVDSLRTRAGVQVLLPAPRVAVDVAGNPSRGPVDAPVTIVEFSDFQCPYCSRAIGTLKKVEENYAGKVRLVYRDYPLVQIHPDAARAAEAASCANDQGKFWAMHDALFAHQDKLSEPDLTKTAADLGLDPVAFEQCLASGRHAAEWKKDAADAERYGVSSTPVFFINGRLVVGAQPYEAFARVIDEELARAGVAPGSSKDAATQ